MDVAQLVAEHHRAVYGFAYRLTGSVHDAEDLTQQVFLVAQQKLGQLRKIESTRSWLLTIARNHFLKTCQKRQPTPAANLKLDVDTIPSQTPKVEEIDRERLQEAINQLPEEFRVVLVLYYFQQRSYREIAEDLGVPMGTVMSRLARAKGHLRSKLFAAEHAAAKRQQPSVAK